MCVCSLVQFPLLGIAAQASPFDEQDAPDSTPRGSFNAISTMVCMYVCMNISLYVYVLSTYVCMYVYVCMFVCMSIDALLLEFRIICTNVDINLCVLYVCMYVCLYLQI